MTRCLCVATYHSVRPTQRLRMMRPRDPCQQVLALGKPTVIVMINGGMVSIDNIAGKAQVSNPRFYPGCAMG
jgi:hypothetical protein